MSDHLSTASQENLKSVVVSLFKKAVNPFKAYFDCELRKLAPTKSTTDFTTALRSLVSDCDFVGSENHHLTIRKSVAVTTGTLKNC
ncbi:hypothetical protein PoB_006449700 [Plakobranchus ocellatus]|uniref:Uncharacterized protein n=1 Tax=Plakobranchus ocellatus TaxID=259542 RepID=A0AAV4D1G7_9GAST|nr:hypothetical protein PoB_006449700 [Plakobranchus ocellatus]